jgi:hypothetical protein
MCTGTPDVSASVAAVWRKMCRLPVSIPAALRWRVNLAEVRECEGEPDLELDKIVGYLASEQLRAVMQLQASLN